MYYKKNKFQGFFFYLFILNDKQSVAMYEEKAFKRALKYDLQRKYKTNVSDSQLRIVYVLWQLTVGRSLHLTHK